MSKKDQYNLISKTIHSVCDGEDNLIANLANTSAIIIEQFKFLWVGFYFVNKIDNQLILGPFQGPLACTRINYGKGVCGQSWKEAKAIVVADVNSYPGHIACSSLSQSEVVIPILRNGEVMALLDIDSAELGSFDHEDLECLTEICEKLSFYF
jgi:GAF domain-containing protein